MSIIIKAKLKGGEGYEKTEQGSLSFKRARRK